MALGIFKRIELEGISEGWGKEAHLKFKALNMDSLKEIQKAGEGVDVSKAEVNKKNLDSAEKIMSVIKSRFVSGRVYNEAMELVDATIDDVDDLYVIIPDKFVSSMMGETNPKSIPQSNGSLSTDQTQTMNQQKQA